MLDDPVKKRAHNPTFLGWATPGAQYGALIAAIAERIRTTPEPALH